MNNFQYIILMIIHCLSETHSILTECPVSLLAKSGNLSPWASYLTSLCLSFRTCKVRLVSTHLIGTVVRIRAVNIFKYLTRHLVRAVNVIMIVVTDIYNPLVASE